MFAPEYTKSMDIAEFERFTLPRNTGKNILISRRKPD